MAEREKSFSPPTTGGASLLTIFAVLCLTVFALLCLSTVRADSTLSEASARAVEDYYAADSKAQEILAQLRFGEFPGQVTTDIVDYPDRSETVCRWSVPISDTQELQVEAAIRGTYDYTILRWRSAPVGDWEFDDSLDLWDGELLD